MPSHHAEWLELSTHDVLEKSYAGLILEIVATQDISEGDEVFLDYGNDWNSAWKLYMDSWNPRDESDDYVPVEVLNADPILKTEEEQYDEPYPENIMILCFLTKTEQLNPTTDDDDDTASFEWNLRGQTLSHLQKHLSSAKRCRILQRLYDTTSSSNFYTVNATLSDKKNILMTGVPREAIQFFYLQYQGDQFISGSFRHEIQIPDDIFPKPWRDLEIVTLPEEEEENFTLENEDESTDHQCHFYIAESSIPNAGIGLFAGVDMSDGDRTQLDVAIHIHDYHEQKKLRCELNSNSCESEWMISSYVRLLSTLTINNRFNYFECYHFDKLLGMGQSNDAFR